MNAPFAINDKVVCINDDWTKVISWTVKFGVCPTEFPKKDKVYTVRDLRPGRERSPWVIALVGIQGSLNDDGTERYFPAQRFRLVSEVGHPAVNLQEQKLSQ